MKKSFLLAKLIFICSYFNSFSQNAFISGNISDKSADFSEIWFCRSLNEDPVNCCYMYDSAVIKNGYFSKFIKTSNPGFLIIPANKYLPTLFIIYTKGDSIKLSLEKDSVHSFISYNGSNAKGQQLLNESPLYKLKKLYPILDSILKTQKTFKDAIINTENIKRSFLKPFEILYLKKEITISFFKAVKAQANSKFLNTMNIIIKNHLEFPEKAGKIHLARSSLIQLQKSLFKKYNPFSFALDNIDQVLRASNVQAKCELIKNGTLPGVKKNIGLWVSPQELCNSYAPARLQYQIMAINLSITGFIKSDSALSNKNFKKFQKIFPNSPYIKFLKPYFTNDEKITGVFSPYTFASYDKRNRVFEKIEVTYYKDLSELIKLKFPNKPVFVDVWATYCGPCKQEFRYSDLLSIFLSRNNITPLYISVDPSQAGNNWAKDIKNYDLDGYHYFAADDINAFFGKLLNTSDFTIPRYILFNEKGEMVDSNALKPSEQEKLYLSILKKLNR